MRPRWFGVALYVISPRILGWLFVGWFQEHRNQLFELFIHAVGRDRRCAG